MQRRPFSRRGFLKGAGGVAAGSALGVPAAAARRQVAEVARVRGEVEVELAIDGAVQRVVVEPRTTLLSALRTRCEPPLTGAKLVCDGGACGACTVLVDGEPRYACMLLALDAVGREIRTVEGLAQGGELSPVQQAFCEEDALMCGFCTPGFVMSITACLEDDPKAGDEKVRQACAGNLCRCGTYTHIFAAARSAGRRMGAK